MYGNNIDFSGVGFPLASVIGCVLTVIITAAAVIGYGIYVQKKVGIRPRPLIVGVGVFIVAAMILESGFHSIILGTGNPVGNAIKSNPYVLALYSALCAGLFEECGRFIGMIRFGNMKTEKESALSVGLGHGGVEALIIAVTSLIPNMAMALNLYRYGYDGILKGIKQENLDTVKSAVAEYYNTASGEFYMGGVERLIAFAIQVALSVVVFMAIRVQGEKKYLGIAILLHTAVDFFAGLYQAQVITSVYLVEGITAVQGILICVYAYRLYKKSW